MRSMRSSRTTFNIVAGVCSIAGTLLLSLAAMRSLVVETSIMTLLPPSVGHCAGYTSLAEIEAAVDFAPGKSRRTFAAQLHLGERTRVTCARSLANFAGIGRRLAKRAAKCKVSPDGSKRMKKPDGWCPPASARLPPPLSSTGQRNNAFVDTSDQVVETSTSRRRVWWVQVLEDGEEEAGSWVDLKQYINYQGSGSTVWSFADESLLHEDASWRNVRAPGMHPT